MELQGNLLRCRERNQFLHGLSKDLKMVLCSATSRSVSKQCPRNSSPERITLLQYIRIVDVNFFFKVISDLSLSFVLSTDTQYLVYRGEGRSSLFKWEASLRGLKTRYLQNEAFKSSSNLKYIEKHAYEMPLNLKTFYISLVD